MADATPCHIESSATAQGWISDRDDDAEKFESDSDGDLSGSFGRAGSPIAPSRNQLGAPPGPSMLVRQLSDWYKHANA